MTEKEQRDKDLKKFLSKEDWAFLLSAMKIEPPLKMIQLPDSQEKLNLETRRKTHLCFFQGNTPEDFDENPFQLVWRSKIATKWLVPYSEKDKDVEDRICRFGIVSIVEKRSLTKQSNRGYTTENTSSKLPEVFRMFMHFGHGTNADYPYNKMLEKLGGKERAIGKLTAAINAKSAYTRYKAREDEGRDEVKDARAENEFIECIRSKRRKRCC